MSAAMLIPSRMGMKRSFSIFILRIGLEFSTVFLDRATAFSSLVFFVTPELPS